MKHTSSVNDGILDLGEKTISTLAVPPRGCNVTSCVGVRRRMFLSCSSAEDGVMPRWKVIGAGLLFIIGTVLFTVCPTRIAPNFTILSRGLATSIYICKKSNETQEINIYIL